MMRYVVTGAAGFIGSHLVDSLLAQGATVTGVDSFEVGYSRDQKERNITGATGTPGYSLVEMDVRDTESLGRLITPDTVVVHLAARAGVRPSLADPAGYVRSNIEATVSVTEAMATAGATRLVFASSSSVYGDTTPPPFREDAPAIHPISPYGATKRAGELLLESLAPTRGLAVAALRYFTVYGPRQRPDLAIHSFALRMLRKEPITLFGDGSQARDYTYCDDIIAGTLAACDWTGGAPPGVEVFNLGGRRPVGLQEVVELLSRALGVEPLVRWAPMQPGDVHQTAADIEKAGRILGFLPRVNFEDGLARFVRWLRQEHAAQS
jgi:UDP-glucuronate 4-epimerase